MKIYFFILGIVILSSCAHHPDVRPGSSGVHKVVVKNESEEEANREALRQAQSYCESQKKSVFIVNESQSYVGKNMDENSYNNAKTATKILGAAGAIFGGTGDGERTRKTGVHTSQVGVLASEALGEGYSSIMTFKCQ